MNERVWVIVGPGYAPLEPTFEKGGLYGGVLVGVVPEPSLYNPGDYVDYKQQIGAGVPALRLLCVELPAAALGLPTTV